MKSARQFRGCFIVLCVHGVGLIQVLNAMIENSTSPEVPKERRVRNIYSVCTALQTIVSMIKMVYFLFIQRKLFILLTKAQSHEIIRNIDVFHKDFAISHKLKTIIHDIMEINWKDIRGQLIFYICCCAAIISNYFFVALFKNIYHEIKKTPDYEHILLSARLFKLLWSTSFSYNENDIRGQLIFYICCCAAIISNYFFDGIFKNYYHEIKKTPDYEHILPFPAVYPIWENKGMSFPLLSHTNVRADVRIIMPECVTVSFDGVFIVLCVHGVGLIQVLNAMIENSTSPEVPKERRVEYLRYCIFHTNLCADYRQIFTDKSVCHKFLLSLLIWGIVLFQMSIGFESNKMTMVRMVLYLSAAGYEIVIFCYNSQRLTSEVCFIFKNLNTLLIYLYNLNLNVKTLYNCEWYNESEEFKQLIRMMILRTNRIFNLKYLGLLQCRYQL
ncbi:Odorant receptor 63a [Lucilia cuprina]|nr:Odorant receptor 63a [Lucilia cuprina]